jgi:hypothetical protein
MYLKKIGNERNLFGERKIYFSLLSGGIFINCFLFFFICITISKKNAAEQEVYV